MILTWSSIINSLKDGDISISPFNECDINPNSYNYHLGDIIKCYDDISNTFKEIVINEHGYALEPWKMYLWTTFEKLWSKKYAMSLIWRSSLWRLGLFLQVSANLWHTGSNHCWTLEIVACRKIKIYPRMRIGQISFWENFWEIHELESTYAQFSIPQESFINF